MSLGLELTPSGFTGNNLLTADSTTIYLNKKISTTAGEMTTSNGNIVIELSIGQHIWNKKPVWRFRGWTPAMATTNCSKDGGTTWSAANFYGSSYNIIDDYGDTLWRITYNDNATNLKVRICLGRGDVLSYSAAITESDVRDSFGIITLDEIIGNITGVLKPMILSLPDAL